MKRVYLSEIENIEEVDDDTEMVLDDRMPRYDEKSDRLVYPGQPGYDDLPDISR